MEETQGEREREGMKCSIVIIIICNCIRPLPKDLHSLAATGFCYLHQQLVAALNYNYRAREPASNTYWGGGGFRTNKLLVVSHPKGSRRGFLVGQTENKYIPIIADIDIFPFD